MTQKTDPHIFTGMQRDLDANKHKSEFLFDALNIRFTPMEGNTLLSITNEKGPKYESTVKGRYLGHFAFNDYIIVFTTGCIDDHSIMIGEPDIITWDGIYKVRKDHLDKPIPIFIGNLGFNISHKIEALGVYETDNLRKVYWVDGLNQPRMLILRSNDDDNINFLNDSYTNAGIRHYEETPYTQYDFVQTLQLEEEVTVERIEGNGLFAPGVIQYAFSYYKNNGQESNLFYTTPLQYISFIDRGGSPEDRVENTFKITITNIDKNFDCLRVYSIHRTTLNAEPTCKRVTDIDLSLYSASDIVTAYDPGTIGDVIDNKQLLYIGGELITASTIAQKDNTLFLGNLNLNRPEFSIEENDINSTFVTENKEETVYRKGYSSGYYYYTNGLKYHVKGFKNREHYRLGVQFQHKTGKWSSPVFLGDYIVGSTVDTGVVLNNPNQEELNDRINFTSFQIKGTLTANNNSGFIQALLAAGYIKARPVCVFPDINDRLILTQGLLCPTVYNVKSRMSDAPYAQSSWFFRLSPNVSVSEYNDKISWLEFRHNHLLPEETTFRGEIMGTEYAERVTQNVNPPVYTTDSIYMGDCIHTEDFAVDQSILTMHSPEIEFTDEVNFTEGTDWKLRLVGYANFTSVYGDISIQTETAPLGGGFHDKKKGYYDSSLSIDGLVATSGVWYDKEVQTNTNNNETTYDFDSTSGQDWIIYPWHRHGSLNNDGTRSDNSTQSSKLKTKKLANLRFSSYNTWFDKADIEASPELYDYDISGMKTFIEENYGVIKLDQLNDKTRYSNLSYYGDVDTMIIRSTFQSDTSYQSPVLSNQGTIKNDSSLEDMVGGTNLLSISMKYKSSKHLLFGLKYREGEHPQILPSLNSLNRADVSVGHVPIWYLHTPARTYENLLSENPELENYIRVYYYSTGVSLYTYLNELNREDITISDIDWNDPNKNHYLIVPDNDNTEIAYLYTLSRTYNSTLSRYEYSATELDTTASGYFVLESSYKLFFKSKVVISSGSTNHSNVLESMGAVDVDDNTQNNVYPAYKTRQENIPGDPKFPFLYIGELYRSPNASTDFGGNTTEAKLNNLWFPAGEPVLIKSTSATPTSIELLFTEGDTWYQRYDCLKTYPYTEEDENSIVEIGSFMCETRYNADGRWDRRRGQLSSILNDRPTNFNQVNDVYSNQDNFFNYRGLSESYTELNAFPTTITWSMEKHANEVVDTWTDITLANTLDLDGNKGTVNALRVFSDSIYCFQDTGISQILFNSRVQINPSDGVPIEIANSGKVDGKRYITESVGCGNKWSIAVTSSGIYFLDNNTKELYNIGGEGLSTISGTHGFRYYFKNKANHDTLRTFYDYNANDVYLIWDDACLVYNEILGQFTSFMSYEDVDAMYNLGDKFYCIHYVGDHNSNLYSMFEGSYNRFFSNPKPFKLSFISNPEASEDKIFSTLEARVDFWIGNQLQTDFFFDYIKADNEYQNTGMVATNCNKYSVSSKHSPGQGSSQKKFRVWRTDIPRDTTKRLDRIRNQWARIELGMSPVFRENTPIANAIVNNLGTNNIPIDYPVAKYLEGVEEDSNMIEAIESVLSALPSGTQETTPNGNYDRAAYFNLKMQLHDLNVQYYI